MGSRFDADAAVDIDDDGDEDDDEEEAGTDDEDEVDGAEIEADLLDFCVFCEDEAAVVAARTSERDISGGSDSRSTCMDLCRICATTSNG